MSSFGDISNGVNYLFLVECVVIVIVTLFCIFFIPRILGQSVAFILRRWLWHRSKVWFDWDAIQLSPLTGQIMIKDLRIHMASHSIRIIGFRLSWRWWLWRARERTVTTGSAKEDKTQSRIKISLQGVEWFIYNRTSAFDAIINRFTKQQQRDGSHDHPTTHEKDQRESEESSGDWSDEKVADRDGGKVGATPKSTPTEDDEEVLLETNPKITHRYPPTLPAARTPSKMHQVPPLKDAEGMTLSWLYSSILPLDFTIDQGAMVLGNDATANVVIFTFRTSEGTWNAAKSRSKYDLYRDIYGFKFYQPKVLVRTNPDYRGPILEHGLKAFQEIRRSLPTTQLSLPTFLYTPFHTFLRPLVKHLITPDLWSPPPKPAVEKWKGLARYRLHEDVAAEERDGAGKHQKEYAKVTTILDTEWVELTYYADSPGLVPDNPRTMAEFSGSDAFDVGNGDLSPEWGVDINIHGGSVTYGPWADRQRDLLQKAFTPAVFSHSVKTTPLTAGQKRLHTYLKVWITFSEETVLIIPLRETSKNWKYDTHSTSPEKHDSLRKYGWFHVKLGPDSAVLYNMPMVASDAGYNTILTLFLDRVNILSSVNNMELLTAESCRVTCQMPAPLQWNGLRSWDIDVALSRPTIYLLRDHVTLITDLSRDWSSGPGSDYFHFIPFRYRFKLTLKNFKLKLYLNDHNIVNAPLSDDDNVFLNLTGPTLGATVAIPSITFKPQSSKVSFALDGSDLALGISLPLWSSHNSFATENTREIGKIGSLVFDGSYLFFSSVHKEHVEKLEMAILARDVRFRSLGWAIRHLLRLRDCYFGSFTNFTTLEEYKEKRERGEIGDPVAAKYRPGGSDSFEVALSLIIQEGILILPEDVEDCKAAAVMKLSEIQLALRLNDYYMEIVLNVQPALLYSLPDATSAFEQSKIPHSSSKECVIIDGIDLIGNRLFGPQPKTATYLCLWEAMIGKINGHLTVRMLLALQNVGRAFSTNFSDRCNAANVSVALDPDITFFKLSLKGLETTLWSDASAIQVLVPKAFNFNFNDLATADYRSITSIVLPRAIVRMLVPAAHKSSPWSEVGAFAFDLNIDLFSSPIDSKDSAQKQAEFVMAQDKLTHRVSALYPHLEKCSPPSHIHRHYIPYPLPHGNYHDTDNNSLTSSASEELFGKSQNNGYDSSDGDESSSSIVQSRSFHRSKAPSKRTSINTRPTSESSSDESGSVSTSSGSSETTISHPIRHILPSNSIISSLLRTVNLNSNAGVQLTCDTSTFPLDDYDTLKQPAPLEAAGSDTPPTPSDSNDSPSTTATSYIHLRCQEELFLFVTPSALEVIKSLADQLVSVPPSAESVIDSLLAVELSFPEKTSASQEIVSQSSRVEINLAGLRLKTMQLALKAEDAQLLKTESAPLRYSDNASDLVAIVELAVGRTDCLLETAKYRSLQSCPQTRLHLKAVDTRLSVQQITKQMNFANRRRSSISYHGDDRGARTDLNILVALDLQISDMVMLASLSSESNDISVKVGDSSIEWLDSTCELLVGSAFDYMTVSRDLKKSLASRHVASLRRTLYAVWYILSSAKENNITTDPAFFNSSSYLLSGTAYNIRSALGWQIVAHLRHCYRRLTTIQVAFLKKQLARRSGPVMGSSDDLYASVVETLRGWRAWERHAELENTEDVHVRLLATLHSATSNVTPPPVPVSQKHRFPLLLSGNSLTVSLGHLIVNHQDATGIHAAAGRFKLGPYNLTFRSLIEHIMTSSSQRKSSLRFLIQSALGNFGIEVTPALLILIRHVLKIRRLFDERIRLLREEIAQPVQSAPAVESRSKTPLGFESCAVEASFLFQKIGFNLQVNGLELDLAGDAGQVTTSVLIDLPSEDQRKAQVFGAAGLFIDRLKVSAHDVKGRSNLSRRTLLAIELSNASSRTNFRQTPSETGVPYRTSSAVLTFGRLRNSAEGDLRGLYTFISEWKKRSVPSFEPIVQDIFREIEAHDGISPGPAPVPPVISPSARQPFMDNFSITILLKQLEFDVRVNPELWISWAFFDVMLDLEAKETSSFLCQGNGLGIQLGSQKLRFVPTTPSEIALPSRAEASVQVSVPALRVESVMVSSHHSVVLQVVVVMDFVDVLLRPEVIDGLVTAVLQFAREVAELYSNAKVDFQKADAVQPSASPAKPFALPPSTISVALRGFRVGLEGMTSTQYLEASMVKGRLQTHQSGSSPHAWSLSIEHLALSLAHISSQRTTAGMVGTDRRYRSAYATVDVKIQNKPFSKDKAGNRPSHHETDLQQLNIRLEAVHGMVQAAAVSALADLIDHYIAELKTRLDKQSVHLEQLGATVEKILATDNAAAATQNAHHNTSAATNSSWLDQLAISLVVDGLGFALPLTFDEIYGQQRSLGAVPAFLFSIPRMEFFTKRYETGRADISSLSLQFVPCFDQTQATHFDGATHASLNRIMFTRMHCEVHNPQTEINNVFLVKSYVDGLNVDLDTNLPTYVFGLLDVYHHGKRRLEKLQNQHATEFSTSWTTQPETSKVKISSLKSKAKTIEASFEFVNGVVSLHTLAQSVAWDKDDDHSLRRVVSISQGQKLQYRTDSITLPKASLWCDYYNPNTSSSSNLILRVLIHGSQNVLHPTILPFFIHTLHAIEHRIGQEQTLSSPEVPLKSLPPETAKADVSSVPFIAPPTFLKDTNIRFSIKIDDSWLRLMCERDVVAGVHWKSGGAILNLSPGFEAVDFGITVGGVSGNLTHRLQAITSEDEDSALEMEARDIAIAVSLSKLVPHEDQPPSIIKHALTITIDTQFSGKMQFSRFQDWLTFKAVWLDSLPAPMALASQIPEPQPSKPISLPEESSIQVVAVLLRVRPFKLFVNLGSSSLDLQVDEMIFRNYFGAHQELSFSFNDMSLLADGELSGNISLPSLALETLRHSKNLSKKRASILMTRLNLGTLNAYLCSNNLPVLRLELEPVSLRIWDDWSSAESKQELRANFDVTLGKLDVALTSPSIGFLLSLITKVRVLHLEAVQAAASDSLTYKVTQASAKAENKMMDLARGMIDTARAKVKHEIDAFSLRTLQHLKLSTGSVRIIAYPDSMGDVVMFGVKVDDLSSVLTRDVRPSIPIHRVLDFKVTGPSLRRYEPRLSKDKVESTDYSASGWITMAIASASKIQLLLAPSISVYMDTTETSLDTYDTIYRLNFDGYLSVSLNPAFWKQFLNLVTGVRIDVDEGIGSWQRLQSALAQEYNSGGAHLNPEAPVTDVEHTYTFNMIEEVLDELRLRQLGEATGATKAFITPYLIKSKKYIHELGTKPLDTMMMRLDEMYKKQLPNTSHSMTA